VKTCANCPTRATCTSLCGKILPMVPSTAAGPELILPSSKIPRLINKAKLTTCEMERSASTGPIRLPGVTSKQVRLLHGKYIDRLSHRELAAKYGITEGSCRVIVSRLRKLYVKSVR
jgi:hypothetical protein